MKHFFTLVLALLLAGCDHDETTPEYWQPVKVLNNTSRIYSMTEVHFSSPQVGWLSGGIDQSGLGHPVLLKTTDGGQSWNSIDLAALRIGRFIAFYPVSDQVLYACAGDLSAPPPTIPRLIYKSADGGQNWTKLPSTGLISGSARLFFFNEQEGLSANIGVVQKTTDGGRSWRTVYTEPLSGLNQLQLSPSGTGYAAGGSGTDPAHSAGILLRTTDGGETWQPLAWPYAGIATLSFADAHTGVAVAWDRQVYATADGGSTWRRTGRAPDTAGSLGVFPSPREGFLPGTGLYHTRDGGASWQTERQSPDQDYFSALGFSPTGVGIAATSNGLIFLRR